MIKPRQIAPGSTKRFSWYFEGDSTVTVTSVSELTAWLAECRYVGDMDLFHEADYWQHPKTFEQLRRGDCEDHALWAWRKLVELRFKADLYIGQYKPAPNDSGHHAWVVFERDGTSYLLEPAYKDSALQVQPLAEVKAEYRPHFSVDSSYRIRAREGLLLFWHEEELARRENRKRPQQVV